VLQPGSGNDDRFVKSSYSASGTCVEVARGSNGRVLVRHSRDRSGPYLSFTESEWKAFLRGVKDDEFDLE
jgi:Domain of unknown function (DUF397)